jgi:uncharacterized ion transporter superfamily protein YfcC
VKKDPKKSPVYETDAYWRKHVEVTEAEISLSTPKSAWFVFVATLATLIIFSWQEPYTIMKIGNSSEKLMMIPIATAFFALFGLLSLRKSIHFFILNILMFTIVFLIIGVMGYGWYIEEIASLFLAMGLLSGAAMNYNANKITKLFIEGAGDILSAALVVGLAGGILVILEDGRIIDTILNSVSSSMAGMGKFGTVSVMYVIQNMINVIIPSGSAKAALTMPVMAPFSDLVNLSRQATVMAFQFGDGFTNMITPTSGVLIGVLGVAKIPYDRWVKWIWPFMLVLIILGWLLLIPTVSMPLNGF